MQWTDICITVPKTFAETAEAIATSISGGGIYIEDYSDLESQVYEIAHVDLIEQDLLDKDRDKVLVHLYLAPDENPAQVIELLRDRLAASDTPYQLEVSGVEQEDWETGWKAYYHAMTLGKRLAIVPSWEEFDTDRVVIRLDPGMAFGTGTHETTALCLETLDELIVPGDRVLDIGTGSGILAIAALKLGASSAQGIDIDPMCVRTATENAQLNGVDDKLEVLIGDLSDKATGTYQMITANIVANAILSLAPHVPALMAPGGWFVASGIIDTRRDEVIAGLEQAGLKVVEVKEKRGWVALVCKNGGEA
ncbi:MAG: 50S ribosomal protein L11 methyltransferase [Candidatus Fournierella pullistercoris]|uniref:Ribosomal protein L11 methyltransferase n=1 Tax=Candidatus Allofournierella pullistercoris TaxID=2838597 RepID=A0A948T233_9FIRM|nr:50S ribosomal protein L11 methyltransferase [Candidatus Fournierella pullistercoris]